MNTQCNPKLSVVSPVYLAENIVDKLVQELQTNLATITEDYEIILVDDGSHDNSWLKIEQNCQRDKRIKGIQLSRNFGQHHAITAGVDHVSGEWMVVMDCDLQDRPNEIPKLYQKALEGFDIVFAQRQYRTDSLIKKSISKLFYRLYSYLTDIPQDNAIANFGIYHRKTIDALSLMREPTRAFSAMMKWVGYKKTSVEVKQGARYAGKSTYTYAKLFRLAFEIIIAYSDKPLRLAVKFGVIIAAIAFLAALGGVLSYLAGSIISIMDFLLLVSLWLLGGCNIFLLGIVGLYIGKTLDGVKDRPIYLVAQSVNIKASYDPCKR